MNEAITVRKLIELLQQEEPDALVVLSRDPEGNQYSPLGHMRSGMTYAHERDWFFTGEVYGPDEEVDLPGDTEPAVVLWPMA